MHFNDIINAIVNGLSGFRIEDALDILIITVLVYMIIKVSVNTSAHQLLKGLAVLLVVMLLSTVFNLYTIKYLMNTLLVSGIVVVVVLFQPELRRALGHIGRIKIGSSSKDKDDSNHIVKELVNAVTAMSASKTGALIVIERNTRLDDYMSTGTKVDAEISSGLIINIFEPNTPLHDGAVIIRDGRIHYAACVLPLYKESDISKALGTRHRAALGVSSVSDSLTLVVSEETGTISYTENGNIKRDLNRSSLTELLTPVFEPAQKENPFSLLKKKLGIKKNAKKEQ